MLNSYLRRIIFAILLVFISFNEVFSQNIEDKKVTGITSNTPAMDFFKHLEGKHNVKIFYKPEWFEGVIVGNNINGKTIGVILYEITQNNSLKIKYRDSYVIFYKPKQSIFNQYKEIEGSSESNITVIGNVSENPTAENVVLSGMIANGTTDNPIYGAQVYVKELKTGATSSTYGYYSISMKPGLYHVTVSYLGFAESFYTLLIKSSGKLNIDLVESFTNLEEVVVTDTRTDENVSGNNMGKTKLDISTIKKMPAFLGEVDIIKSLLLLPGVTSVGEGSAGFNVRGGATDQNLYLFDQVPIFNSAHLFGFFSNFNSDAVESVTLYKGGVPARYGGRASSVLNVTSKEGNTEKIKLQGGIGIISSRLLAEIPVIKGKSSLVIAGRTSYSDWILRKVRDINIKKSSAQFYDANLKWHYNVGDSDKISLSAYTSNDKFKFAADTAYSWQTKNASLTWAHLFNKKIVGSFTGIYSDYNYSVEGITNPFTFELKSRINYKAFKTDFSYALDSSHSLDFGMIMGTYQFIPGDLSVDVSSVVVPIKLENQQSLEAAAYIEDEFIINPKLTITGGLRYSLYRNTGEGDVLLYEDGQTKSQATVIDTLSYQNGDIIQEYAGIEPRFSLKYSINPTSSIKISYNRLRQYIHTISNTTAVSPIDIWKSSDKYIAPQIADQYSIGYFKNFKDNAIETSVEIFYKDISNIIDYKNGAQIVLRENIEQELLSGIGRAYGAEVFLKKKNGRLTGWLSYTYSKSERLVKGSIEEETINNGNYYPASYDKPHVLSVVANHQITKRWSMGFNFTYSTGRPITAPIAKFIVNGVSVAYFSNRNQFRIPDYHRLDFSVSLAGGHKRKKILDGDWTFSVYNVYARKNAYSVFFQNKIGAPPGAYKLSVLGTIFPSLTYNFKL